MVTDINVLMPSLHPAYSTNLVRRTFGCRGIYAGGDELTMMYTTAFAATSRAAVTGDLILSSDLGLQQDEYTPGFHGGAYDSLYYKGKTIRLVRERLAQNLNGQGELLSEPLMHAICNLVLMEVSSCTFQSNILLGRTDPCPALHWQQTRSRVPYGWRQTNCCYMEISYRSASSIQISSYHTRVSFWPLARSVRILTFLLVASSRLQHSHFLGHLHRFTFPSMRPFLFDFHQYHMFSPVLAKP